MTLNLLDPDISLAQALVAGTSCSHPADPENKEDLVDPALLAEILQLGFEEAIAVLAISKTKGIFLFFALWWIISCQFHLPKTENECNAGIGFSDMCFVPHRSYF